MPTMLRYFELKHKTKTTQNKTVEKIPEKKSHIHELFDFKKLINVTFEKLIGKMPVENLIAEMMPANKAITHKNKRIYAYVLLFEKT